MAIIFRMGIIRVPSRVMTLETVSQDRFQNKATFEESESAYAQIYDKRPKPVLSMAIPTQSISVIILGRLDSADWCLLGGMLAQAATTKAAMTGAQT